MPHSQLLIGKEETLLKILDPNVLLLALLSEQELLDECTEQAIAAERTNFERNRRLLQWLKQSPQDAFEGFIRALRSNGQHHVANFIDGTLGDLPLREDVRKRLRRIKAKLVEILYTERELLDNLLWLNVINETDFQSILAETTMNQKNAKLIDVILRGSERGLQCFMDSLVHVRQSHVVDYINAGEVLMVHVEITSDTNTREKEDGILTLLRKIISKVSTQELPEELSEDQRSHASHLLKELKSVIVGAQMTRSISMFVLVSTLDSLDAVQTLYESGQLNEIVQQLFCCLSADEDLTVAVQIRMDDFQECKEGFLITGNGVQSELLSVPAPLRNRHGRLKAMSTSEPASCQGIQTMQEEICQLRSQLDDLINRRQQTDMMLGAVKQCLESIEADSALSAASVTAVNEAKQHIDGFFEAQETVCDTEKTTNWLQHRRVFRNEDITDRWPVMYGAASDYGESSVGGDDMSVDTGYISYCTRSLQGLLTETPSYSMSRTRRGRFIIISNTNFHPTTHLLPRRGLEHDVEMLEDVFTQLGFQVSTYSDQTAKEMLAIMMEAAEQDHSNYDCFAVTILSHGENGNQVLGVDGETIDVSVLSTPVKRCTSLAGKPKIFLIEAGRGREFDEGLSISEMEDATKSRIPLEADMLFAYSTVEGYLSWRNASRGSWFIQALCQELREVTTSGVIDLEQVLTRVRYQVAYNQETISSNKLMSGKKQIPAVYSTLTKELHFPCKD